MGSPRPSRQYYQTISGNGCVLRITTVNINLFRRRTSRALFLEKGASTGAGGDVKASSKASNGGNFSGLNICPIRLSPNDSYFHVLFFDTEALVIELLACDKLV